MQITTRTVDEVVVLDLAGRLDWLTVGELDKAFAALAGRPRPRCVIGLDGVSYISSAGLGAILRLARALREQDGELRLSGATAMVATVIDTTSLDSLIGTHATEKDALAAFADG